MSNSTNFGFSVERATRYNAKSSYARKLARVFPLLSDMLDGQLSGLASNPRGDEDERARFAFSAAVLQRDLLGFSEDDVDGAVGPYTFERVSVSLDPRDRSESHLVLDGRRRAFSLPSGARVVGLDAVGSSDVSRFGHFRRSPDREILAVCVHWGGANARHLGRVFSNDTREVSSHLGVDSGELRQYLDLGVVAYHAGGKWNRNTIGLDVSQLVLPKHESAYNDPEISPVRNEERDRARWSRRHWAGRGFDPILSLKPETARNARETVFALLDLLGLDAKAPRDEEGRVHHGAVQFAELGVGFTVFGHHHCKSKKSDVIGWWGTIFDGTPLGD